MNRDEQFEKRLSRQPAKSIPSAWRAEILSAAERAADSAHASRITHHVPWWRELFWPCPQAWAALAAAWLVICTLNFAMREPAPANLARLGGASSPQLRELLKQQEQLFAELVEPLRTPEAERRRIIAPAPHSSRRGEFRNA